MRLLGKRSMVGALVALATAAVLSACAGQPGAAAVVGGTAIPGSDLQTALDELGPYVQGASPAAVLGVLVIEPTVTEMAAEAGVAASDEDAQAFLESVVKQNTPDANPTFSAPSLAIARYFVAYDNLAKLSSQDQVTTDIGERVAKLDIQVNPRYATLGKDNVITAATPPTWIVAPPTPAPTPPPAPGDGSTPTPSATP